jgi:hypothetical protein
MHAPAHVCPPSHPLQAANTHAFLDGSPWAQHALVAGPPGSGKSWLLWASTLAEGRERGLRLVDVPGGEVGGLLEAARGAGRYPRCALSGPRRLSWLGCRLGR